MADRRMMEDDPRAPMTVVVAIVGAIAVFVIVILLQALYYRSQEAETAKKVVAEAPQELSQLRAKHVEELNSYHWVDEKAGIVAIPIDRAMELVVGEEGKRPEALAPGNAIPTSPPAPSARNAKDAP